MNKNYVVYTISFQGKVMYVGKTYNFKKRKYQHLKFIGTKHSAIPKDLDLNDISIEDVSTFDQEEEALKFEGQLISKYDTISNGWNIRKSGLVTSNMKEYHKNWESQHRKERNGQKRVWRANNLEHRREYEREWKQTYRAKLRSLRDVQITSIDNAIISN